MNSTLESGPSTTSLSGNPSGSAAPGSGGAFAFGENQITVDDASTPDLVMVKITKSDGRCLRRNIPRECWMESNYRQALLKDMATMLA